MATAGAMRVLEKRLQQEAAAAATVPESPPPGTPGTGELGGVDGWRAGWGIEGTREVRVRACDQPKPNGCDVQHRPTCVTPSWSRRAGSKYMYLYLEPLPKQIRVFVFHS